ncbi:hypothetical protein K7I13_04220 [Brucepastera parasyntrophica]|uniref:hypothetical protein n=1 Tax=Brucepastera parasyntrophica TaxID=2880008 RepID=UPI00210A663A|nr:hypothetical protein [Brucepastera parasyntrophica]ULQ60514.1 hypothetical protein K7I13_04220 [Brucepastera parasyntrophica]
MREVLVKRNTGCTDNEGIMTMPELLNLLKSVILSPQVIGITIVLVLYFNLVFYVSSSRKKRQVRQQKRRTRTPPAAPPAPEEGAAEESGQEETATHDDEVMV